MSTTAKPTKKAAPKKKSNHPTYIVMIKAAIANEQSKKGSSKHFIEKYIANNYKDITSLNTHLKMALKKGVESKVLTHPSGVGANGRFRVSEAKKVNKKKAST